MATLAQNNGGQNHDRITPLDDSLSLPDMLPTKDNGGGGGGSSGGHVEITAAQKMLSATSGSLLTALLGMPPPRATPRILLTCAHGLQLC